MVLRLSNYGFPGSPLSSHRFIFKSWRHIENTKDIPVTSVTLILFEKKTCNDWALVDLLKGSVKISTTNTNCTNLVVEHGNMLTNLCDEVLYHSHL